MQLPICHPREPVLLLLGLDWGLDVSLSCGYQGKRGYTCPHASSLHPGACLVFESVVFSTLARKMPWIFISRDPEPLLTQSAIPEPPGEGAAEGSWLRAKN